MNDTVSIIIPCHNAGPWLAATLDSVLAQTCSRREVILVDDGSSDNSLEVARSYEDRGVHVLTQPNRGAASARNAGLAAATGGFIQFLDADDLLAPDKIERQLTVLANGNGRQLTSGAWGRFRDDPSSAVFSPQAVANARTGVEFLQLHYETGSMMQPDAWLAPRSLLDEAGPWNEELSVNDDGEYFARAMLAARELVPVPEARSYYRAHVGSSLSRRKDPTGLRSLFRSVELTTGYLQVADRSSRTRSACAHAWKRLAFEVYPVLPDLAREAETRCRKLGGSRRPMPGSGRFQLASRVLGWRLARRLFS